MIAFEWDPAKASDNLRKHRVAFTEAATVFRDPLGITAHDPHHSDAEDRYLTVGASAARRLLIIAHTERRGRIRIISARELNHRERREYENEIKRRRT
jgi:hypothetical protein